ncbi:hypothetical protein ACOSQ2_028596 [Xanthoceras sorbifolium]
MAVTSKDEVCSSSGKQKEPKRTKFPGVRVIHGIIYDSENGKTCHQCRQKTRVFSAACKNQKGHKQCTIRFCHKCLLNRYGEKAEAVALLDDWKCPKCRGICNCSQCMKKRGQKPTGQLAHAAKAIGFSSVSEMLLRGHNSTSHEKRIAEETVISLEETLSPKKESITDSFKKPGKENSVDGNCDSNLNSQNLMPILNERKSEKKKREGLKEICNSNGDDDISLGKKTPKEPKISEGITKKESATTSGENSKKEKLIISEEISKDKKPTVSESSVSKDVITNEKDGGDFVEKKKSKKQLLKNDSLTVIKKAVKHDAINENVRDPNGIENNNAGPKLKAVSESRKVKKCPAEFLNKEFAADIQLPQGAYLTTIAGTEITPEDAGHALQFLEFCAAFGEVLDLKKGQAEYIIRELIRGRIRRRGKSCPIVQIHIQLLSLIQEDMEEKSPLSSTSGKNCWLQALWKCVSESKCPLNDIPSHCFDSGDGYDMLDCTRKLKLLNFLCDEALSTTALRSWIDDQNSKFLEREKQARRKVCAAKDKEKQLKNILQTEAAKSYIAENDGPLSVAEHEDIISKIKSEAAQAHSEMLNAMGMVSKKRKISDAVRTEPILLEDNGHVFWRLKGYASKADILLQDLQGNWDAIALNEKWVVYDADKKPAIENYISLRSKRRRVQKVTDHPIVGSVETDS